MSCPLSLSRPSFSVIPAARHLDAVGSDVDQVHELAQRLPVPGDLLDQPIYERSELGPSFSSRIRLVSSRATVEPPRWSLK
jgi:hypothetical protein